MACVQPVYDNHTQLVKIQHGKGSAAILYVGTIRELFYSSIINSFIFHFT